jgi:hydroxyacylglutathione hydrolase
MRHLSDGLSLLRGFPPFAVNVYLMGDVLVDAGTRYAARRILRPVRGHRVSALALTHAHPDHQGSCHAVCEALRIPLWCGAADAPAVEDSDLMLRAWGDEVGGFVVLETPGHCAGHVSFRRAADRVLLLGDLLANFSPPLGLLGLREPPSLSSPDPAENRRSARRVAALEPALIRFVHGPPMRAPPPLRSVRATTGPR